MTGRGGPHGRTTWRGGSGGPGLGAPPGRLVVEWAVAEPSALGVTLADALRLPRPDPGAEHVAFILVGGALILRRTRPGESEGLALPPGVVAPGAGRGQPGVRLLGVGWATVDLDRGAIEAAARLGCDPASLEPADADAWLGARCRRVPVTGSATAPVLVILEPATEGRLAAALARSGEGPVAVYLGVPGPALEPTRRGPLGPAALLPPPRPWGPFVLSVPSGTSRAAARDTIGR